MALFSWLHWTVNISVQAAEDGGGGRLADSILAQFQYSTADLTNNFLNVW